MNISISNDGKSVRLSKMRGSIRSMTCSILLSVRFVSGLSLCSKTRHLTDNVLGLRQTIYANFGIVFKITSLPLPSIFVTHYALITLSLSVICRLNYLKCL
jgi:hypothetical protein